jgi:dihydrofolate synthase/folylpolyglutamate synthase
MNKSEAIAYLYQLPHLHPRNDLSYIKTVLQALGNPQAKTPAIHVTGTNGKGSTCYYLSALLKQAGQKTGLFVSPYVIDFNERIQINGRMISDQLLLAAFAAVKTVIDDIQADQPQFQLTTFEFETCMAFWAFNHERCDYAVIEVGIGGEHDKTNVITPVVSIITTIGLDHEQLIGPTLADIAREKSGIIKAQRPVVLGNVPAEVLPIVLAKAKAEAAPVVRLGRDFQPADFLNKALAEQIDAGCALAAFQQLSVKLGKEQIISTLQTVNVPGRYQVLGHQPLIIADGAHNVQAMSQLLAYVRKLPHRRLYVLLGMMKDKDLDAVLHLFHADEKVYLTRIDYPRAAKLPDFPAWAQARFDYEADYKRALARIMQEAKADDVILITGSFYLVGAVLQVMKVGANDAR